VRFLQARRHCGEWQLPLLISLAAANATLEVELVTPVFSIGFQLSSSEESYISVPFRCTPRKWRSLSVALEFHLDQYRIRFISTFQNLNTLLQSHTPKPDLFQHPNNIQNVKSNLLRLHNSRPSTPPPRLHGLLHNPTPIRPFSLLPLPIPTNNSP
jgi:hypothetical protein